ncbi:hypothetical protein VN97_g7038 [Penicillium thymicola]|uniref:Uncharacterized protein n=1 Tax=Penicillium thymicola TaxID=293382 RepID=A0AAI9TGE1_PENTH|nr:hypothetical protein VN97_g7038 [Penicillium thymicola]
MVFAYLVIRSGFSITPRFPRRRLRPFVLPSVRYKPSWISCSAISTPFTSVAYTVGIPSLRIWHPLSTLNVRVPSSLPLSSVVFAASHSSRSD